MLYAFGNIFHGCVMCKNRLNITMVMFGRYLLTYAIDKCISYVHKYYLWQTCWDRAGDINCIRL